MVFDEIGYTAPWASERTVPEGTTARIVDIRPDGSKRWTEYVLTIAPVGQLDQYRVSLPEFDPSLRGLVEAFGRQPSAWVMQTVKVTYGLREKDGKTFKVRRLLPVLPKD